jgi:hypothetical protein
MNKQTKEQRNEQKKPRSEGMNKQRNKPRDEGMNEK